MEIIKLFLREKFIELEQAGFCNAFLYIVVAILIYVIFDYFISKQKKEKDNNSNIEDQKKGKAEDSPTRKEATIFYQNKKEKAVALYFTEKPADTNGLEPQQVIRKKILLFSLDNQTWYFFKHSKLLVTHDTLLFNAKLQKIEEQEIKKVEGKDFIFSWREQPMEVIHKAQYDANIKGSYPHLIRTNKVLILLAQIKQKKDILEESWGDIYFFERTINPLGQFTINLWTGAELNKALRVPSIMTEEIQKIPQNYFNQKTEK